MENQYRVHINLESVVDRPDSPQETTELKTEGQFYIKDEAYYLLYEERMEEGEAVRNTLKVTDREALVIRKGAVSMRQPLVEGEKTKGVYQNPLGNMHIETKTKQADIRWSQETASGQIVLRYDLNMENQPVGRFQLIFNLWEVQST